jgi:CheY-like chemotaxis protein
MPSGTNGRTQSRRPILVVDDDLESAALAKRAIASFYPDFPVQILGSGKALMDYLEKEAASSEGKGRQLVSLILLDLRMPEMDGFAVLEWLKGHPNFGSIPIIVVSAFDDLSQLRRAYSLRARAYLVKPISPESFHHALSSLNLDL